jgi:hypothetical protein
MILLITVKAQSMDFTTRGTAMGGPVRPGPANQNLFFPTKGFNYRRKYSSVSSAVWVVGLR